MKDVFLSNKYAIVSAEVKRQSVDDDLKQMKDKKQIPSI